MWLGVTAGPFALLVLWLFTSPAQAQSNQKTFNDQELTYLGIGWETVNSPQVCTSVSQTMHTTSTTGDFVAFNFTGTGVIVHGPVTSRSIPLVIALDGVVQPLAAPKNCTNGCGQLYVIGNLADEPHLVQVGYTAVIGTANLSICGISIFANGHSPSLMPVDPTPNGYGDVDHGFSSPQDSSETRLSIGMLVGIIVAIIGAVLLMIALLISCVVVRRRISLNVARSRDQENSFGRGFRRLEEGKLDGLSDVQSVDSNSFKETLSECVIIASGASSTSAQRTSQLSNSSPVRSGSRLTRPVSTVPTLIQTTNDPSSFTHSRQILSPALVPDTPSENDDHFLLPSPRSGRSLLRCSIPIRMFNSESPRQSATVENPFESPRSSLHLPVAAVRNSVAIEETDLSRSRLQSHILVFPFGQRCSEISVDSVNSAGTTEG